MGDTELKFKSLLAQRYNNNNNNNTLKLQEYNKPLTLCSDTTLCHTVSPVAFARKSTGDSITFVHVHLTLIAK